MIRIRHQAPSRKFGRPPTDPLSFFPSVRLVMVVECLGLPMSSRVMTYLSTDSRFSSCVLGRDLSPPCYSEGNPRADTSSVCRYDPPTNLSPTLSHSIASQSLNPIPRLLKLTTTLPPQPISIRLLSPSESPSSQLFMVSEVASHTNGKDVLSEACAVLIAQIGKMKRTGMGWEDKVAFLDFYRNKK